MVSEHQEGCPSFLLMLLCLNCRICPCVSFDLWRWAPSPAWSEYCRHDRSLVNARWRHPPPREGTSSINVMLMNLSSQIPCRKSAVTLSIVNEIVPIFFCASKRPFPSCMCKIRILAGF